MEDNNQGWEKWSNHVLLTLEKLEKKVDTVEKRINENNLSAHVEIVSIKAKAAVWGVIAGFIVSAIVSVIVGVLVYQLTVGFQHPTNTSTSVPTTSQSIGGAYLLPNEDKLDGFVITDREIIS